MPEPVGLGGDAAGDFLQISGDVRKLDPEAADPVRQLIDQTFAVRRHRLPRVPVLWPAQPTSLHSSC